MHTDFSFRMSKTWGVYFCSLTFWKQEKLLFSNIPANSSTGSPSGKWVPPSLQKRSLLGFVHSVVQNTYYRFSRKELDWGFDHFLGKKVSDFQKKKIS